jgi:chemotaxis protein MotB
MKNDREQVIHIVKRPRKHAAHHGGAWKVAFADFMTSMMALFLVLWLVTQSSEVRSAIAGYFQDPLGRAHEFGTTPIPGKGQTTMSPAPTISMSMTQGANAKLTKLTTDVRDALPAAAGDLGSHVMMEVTPDGLRISLVEDSSDVFFTSGSANMLPHAEQLIEAIGSVLGASGGAVEIEGHTDSHPYANGKAYSNWELSADRANAARRALVAGGLKEDQLQSVRGLAERDPRIVADPGAPANRRVTITVKLAPEPAAKDKALASASTP